MTEKMNCPMCNGSGWIDVFDMEVNDTNMLDATGIRRKRCPLGCADTEAARTGNQRLTGAEKKIPLSELKRLKKQHDDIHGAQDYSVTTEKIPIEDWYGLDFGGRDVSHKARPRSDKH